MAAATAAGLAPVRVWFEDGCALTTDLAPTTSASTTTKPATQERTLMTGAESDGRAGTTLRELG